MTYTERKKNLTRARRGNAEGTAHDSRPHRSCTERTTSRAPASSPLAVVLGGVLSPFRGGSRATGVKLSPPVGQSEIGADGPVRRRAESKKESRRKRRANEEKRDEEEEEKEEIRRGSDGRDGSRVGGEGLATETGRK